MINNNKVLPKRRLPTYKETRAINYITEISNHINKEKELWALHKLGYELGVDFEEINNDEDSMMSENE